MAAAKRYVVKVRPGWLEYFALYVAVALASGECKSPVFKVITAPLEDFQRKLLDEFRAKLPEVEAEKALVAGRLKSAKSLAQKGEPDEAQAAQEPARAPRPRCPRAALRAWAPVV